jgi:hypothetical protein
VGSSLETVLVAPPRRCGVVCSWFQGDALGAGVVVCTSSHGTRRVLVVVERRARGLRDDHAERPAGSRGVVGDADPVVRACDAVAIEARVASAFGATEQTPLPVSRERTPRWSSCSGHDLQ